MATIQQEQIVTDNTLRDVLVEALHEYDRGGWIEREPGLSDEAQEAHRADAIIAALATRNVHMHMGWDRVARGDAPTPEPAPTLHFTGTYPQRAVYLPVYGDAPTPEPLREALLEQAMANTLPDILDWGMHADEVAAEYDRLAATESTDTRALDVDYDEWSAGYDEGFAASKRLCEALERST